MASLNTTSKLTTTTTSTAPHDQPLAPPLTQAREATQRFQSAIMAPNPPSDAPGTTNPTNILAGVGTSATYTEKALFAHLLRDHQDEIAVLKREVGELKREVGKLEGEKGELPGLVRGLRGEVEVLRRELGEGEGRGEGEGGKKRKKDGR